jgi:hypothetical protein
MIERDTSKANDPGTLQFTNSSFESTEASGTVLTYDSGYTPLPEGGNQCSMTILGTWWASDMDRTQSCALDACKHHWGHTKWSGHLKHDTGYVRDEFFNVSYGHK